MHWRKLMHRLLSPLIITLLLPLCGWAQSHSAFPINIVSGPSPQPFRADEKLRLAYELHLTNFSASPIEILALDVLGDDASSLAKYRGEELEKLLVGVGPADSAEKLRMVGGGRSILLFLDIGLDSGARPPLELGHRFLVSIARNRDGRGGKIENTVNGPVITVVQKPALVLRAPLRGADWVAFNAFSSGSSPDHRRALQIVDGKMRVAQRFAIDWMRLDRDGRLFRDDPQSNANFSAYGAEVLAVADARVSDLKDGLPDNPGRNEEGSRDITLDNIVGNYLILDLGNARFALYAHLQPNRFKVRLGDQVKAGQVLAYLGNSGNSDAPHLHFQLMDANSPLGAEGVPYEIDAFSQLGVVHAEEALDAGQAWQPAPKATSVVRRREFPLNDAVVTLH